LRLAGIIAFTVVFPLSLSTAVDHPRGRPDQRPASTPDPTLGLYLARAADYCDKLDRSVLNFICREEIQEWFRPDFRPRLTYHGRRTVYVGSRERHRFLYDYQLIRDAEGFISEKRTLLKEDGKDVHIPDSPLKTRTFSHAKAVMGPLGILRRDSQADHDYRILREEEFRGDEALVIEAVPKPGVPLQHLFGRIWLRKADAGILKIEWNPASIGNYLTVAETALRLDMTPDLLVIMEYAFEKNGVRFPSRYTAKEIYRRGKSGARYQIAEVDVTYDEYKFFTVETEVEIRRGDKGP
jgi:hypothetical protein